MGLAFWERHDDDRGVAAWGAAGVASGGERGTSACQSTASFFFALPVMSLLKLNLFMKVAFNAYSGLEQVAVFAGETKNAGRAIMLSAWIAAPAVVVIYAVMTGSMLTYVPASRMDLAGPICQVLSGRAWSGSGRLVGTSDDSRIGHLQCLFLHHDHG